MLCKSFRSRSLCGGSGQRDYGALLQQCGREKDVARGRKLHEELIRLGLDKQTLLGTLLVQMYGACGCVTEAEESFRNIRNPIVFSSNVMLKAFAVNGHLREARGLFDSMSSKDAVSWNSMITAYSQKGDLTGARNLFDEMPNKNTASYNVMLTAFTRCGHLREAKLLFDSVLLRNIVTWNTMMVAYAQRGCTDEAVDIFDQMPERNVITWNALVTGLAQSGELQPASKMFVVMPMWSEICWNAMISSFCHHKRIEEGWKLFLKLPFRGMVSWLVMIQGCIFNGFLVRAWDVFKKMPLTDVVTWTSIVYSFAQQGYLREACSLFEAMPYKDVAAMNSMISVYGLYGDLDRAKQVFDAMEKRDVITWNGMITAYAQNGYARKAIILFRVMDLDGVFPDSVTFVSVLDACALFSLVRFGGTVHAELISSRVSIPLSLATALVNFYGKCGDLETARSLFDNIEFYGVVPLNSMLSSYAQNGNGKQALELFNQSMQLGVDPDSITFISVLSACSHAGLLEDASVYFLLLVESFSLAPSLDHYSCMVDLMGRTGQLSDAEDLLLNMPFEPEYSSWRSLLSACQSYKDVKRGSRVARLAAEMNPRSPSTYVILSRLFDAAGKHNEGSLVRKSLDDKGMKKPAGVSCIVIRDKIHDFIAGGKSHPQIEKIEKELQRLMVKMKAAGYVADTSSVLFNFEEEDKEQALCFHSEKLAIAFGILSTPEKQPLHIVKNLRVCSDCHAATKFISGVTQRKIIVRDAHRFHHFEDGSCSCGDYW